MARLWASGFELNSVTALMEWRGVVGSPTISTTTVRSGTYAGRISSLTSATVKCFSHTLAAADVDGPFFFRPYFYVATLPSAENSIIALRTTAGALMVRITLDSGGLLRLYDEDGQIGSASSAISTGNFENPIELWYDRTPAAGSHIVKARLNHIEFAAATNRNLSAGIQQFRIGGNLNSEAQTVGDWFIDDVAINDNTGSFQNSYPGPGKIIRLSPTAAGDVNTFATQTGGTAGAGNNFTRVDEVTPNDATDFNGSNTLNEEDLFNVTNSGIAASDIVSVVMIGGRFRNNTADATTAFKFECEKAAAGTIAQSAAIVPNSTTWRPNSVADPIQYPLVLHQDPDSANWTQATLDSMQIGYKLTTGGTNRAEVTAVYALVDYFTPTSIPNKVYSIQQAVNRSNTY